MKLSTLIILFTLSNPLFAAAEKISDLNGFEGKDDVISSFNHEFLNNADAAHRQGYASEFILAHALSGNSNKGRFGGRTHADRDGFNNPIQVIDFPIYLESRSCLVYGGDHERIKSLQIPSGTKFLLKHREMDGAGNLNLELEAESFILTPGNPRILFIDCGQSLNLNSSIADLNQALSSYFKILK